MCELTTQRDFGFGILCSGNMDLYDCHFVLKLHRPVQLAFCAQVTLPPPGAEKQPFLKKTGWFFLAEKWPIYSQKWPFFTKWPFFSPCGEELTPPQRPKNGHFF